MFRKLIVAVVMSLFLVGGSVPEASAVVAKPVKKHVHKKDKDGDRDDTPVAKKKKKKKKHHKKHHHKKHHKKKKKT